MKLFYQLDQFNEQTYFSFASNLVYLLDDRVLGFYKNLFQVKKYQTISNCLKLSAQFYSYTFEDNNTSSFHLNQDQMNMPFKVYISEYIVQLMIGVPTVIHGSLINNLKLNKLPQIKAKCINTAAYHFNTISYQQGEEERVQFEYLLMSSQATNDSYLNKFNQLLISYDNYWSSLDLLKRIDSNLKCNQSHSNLILNVSNALEWHIQSSSTSKMDELVQLVDNLKKNTVSIETTLDKLQACEQNIFKRLEWASASSPGLVDTLKAFENLRKSRNDLFNTDVKHAVNIELLMESWIIFEQLRSKTSTFYLDKLNSFESILVE